MSFTVIWAFEPRPEFTAPFITAYGPGGTWERLFATAPGFVSTEMIGLGKGLWLVIDQFTSREAWRACTESAEYIALDVACAAMMARQWIVKGL